MPPKRFQQITRISLPEVLAEVSSRNHTLISFLELLQREQNISKEELFGTSKTSKHHILPLFEQGSPDSWNIIEVTAEEHLQIHQLRYEVYQKEGDKKAIYGVTSIFNRSISNSSDETIEPQKTSVNWGILRRTPEVSLAIQTGMVWTHADGFVCRIEPNTVETVKEIVEKLIICLPENHPDRERLQKQPSVSAYIHRHIETVFPVPGVAQRAKRQRGAYNFCVVPFN